MALRIKEIAKAKGITMGEIADKMGINPVNLSASLNGNPTLNRLQEVAAILGVEVSDLFAQNISDINGYIETGDNIYPVKSREQFVGLIDKIEGIVHIPSCSREESLKCDVKDFCIRSIKGNTSGAIMNRYGINEVFTLSYDSDSKKFSLTLCIGAGNVKFKQFNTTDYRQEDSLTSQEMNRIIEDILSCIESIYEDRIVDSENNRVRLSNIDG